VPPPRRVASASVVGCLLAAALAASCTTVDPGPNFVVKSDTFDADFFYCHVEPQLIVPKQCGPGGMSDNGNCHFNASAVSAMVLLDHPAIDCGGGDHPTNPAQVDSAAQNNLEQVSLEMNRDYLTAPLYLRPTQLAAHPRQIFGTGDPIVQVIAAWAAK
jgi:hypothetical protein